MTELATRDDQSLALATDSTYWNDTQVAMLTQLGVEKATEADLRVYHHVCQRTGLDPFARQIYMIERKGKQTIQTGIDGFRLIARRAVEKSGEAYSVSPVEWCGRDGKWTEVWLESGPPAAARVTVTRGNGTFPAIALYAEYVQTYWKNGSEHITQMWEQRGAGQLAKCAEALAHRKAFPQDLSGIYTDDEMQSANNVVQGEIVEEPARIVTGADLRGDAPEEPQADPPNPMTKRTQGQLFALFAQKGIVDADQLPGVNHLCGTTYTSRSQITEDDALQVIELLKTRPDVEAKS
jgi:phage recombination protein Bet